MRDSISIYSLLKRILMELNTQVVEHGERVAFLELKMARLRGIRDDEHLENLMLACFAHDIGAYKTDSFLSLLKFDAENTLQHCIYGYLFMKYFSPLGDDSEIFLYHHTFYDEKKNIDSRYFDDGVLIHLLDRVDVLNISCENKADIIKQLINNKETIFNPKDVDDFVLLTQQEDIFRQLCDGSYSEAVREYFDNKKRIDRLLEPIINMLAFEVDFKSEQTVIHTVTTALISKCLGQKFELSEAATDELFLAAKLHDLGKIDIPTAILEKPYRLTDDEYRTIQQHCEYTKAIIEELFPSNIVEIAYRHHERLDGSGYPNGLKKDQLNLQTRILQVADVASALIYKRSYKDAMEREQVLKILGEEKDSGKLDGGVIDMLTAHYDEILTFTAENSEHIIRNYEHLQEEYRQYMTKYSDLNHETDSIGAFSITNC